jgi:hypothetical protein
VGLEIIGPGFGRTGTNSLKSALEQPGFGPCHHMFEVRDNPGQLPGWTAAAKGDKVDWAQLLRGYRSQVDWPGARYWRELVATFPQARIILTIRDPGDWYESMQATIIPLLATRGTLDVPFVNDLLNMAHLTVVEQVFGSRLNDRDHAIRVFRAHIAGVQADVSGHRLLCYEVSHGWQPLCNFLQVDVPDAPFPKTNSSKAFVEDEWRGASPVLPASGP